MGSVSLLLGRAAERVLIKFGDVEPVGIEGFFTGDQGTE